MNVSEATRSEEIYIDVLEDVKSEFPSFELVRKADSRFMKFLAFLLFFNKAFMADFVTTIGNTIWVPDKWDKWPAVSRAEVLRHERIHLRQQVRYGMPRYVFMYLLWPLPFLRAKGRTMLEQEAYKESLVARAEYYGVESLAGDNMRESFIGHFTSGEYGWMWTKRADIELWYDTCLEEIHEQSS